MTGFIRANLTFSGFLDYLSLQDSLQLCSNKAPENSDLLLTHSDGNSNSYHMILIAKFLLKKEHMWKDYILKELNGMEKRIISSMQNP